MRAPHDCGISRVTASQHCFTAGTKFSRFRVCGLGSRVWGIGGLSFLLYSSLTTAAIAEPAAHMVTFFSAKSSLAVASCVKSLGLLCSVVDPDPDLPFSDIKVCTRE